MMPTMTPTETMLLEIGIRLAPLVWVGVAYVAAAGIAILAIALRETGGRGSATWSLICPLPARRYRDVRNIDIGDILDRAA